MPKLKDNEFTDKQDQFIYNMVRLGNNPTQSARLAGYAVPRQSAFSLTQSPKILTRIRHERNKVYQTELSFRAVHTLKEVMEDTDAPASARIAAARTSLELAGDIGKHSRSQLNYEEDLSEMTREELNAVINTLEHEKVCLTGKINPVK